MIVFVDVLGLGITLPVLPLYAQNVFGASATQITLLASVYFTAQFLASPRLGRLSDRVGRRSDRHQLAAGEYARGCGGGGKSGPRDLPEFGAESGPRICAGFLQGLLPARRPNSHARRTLGQQQNPS